MERVIPSVQIEFEQEIGNRVERGLQIALQLLHRMFVMLSFRDVPDDCDDEPSGILLHGSDGNLGRHRNVVLASCRELDQPAHGACVSSRVEAIDSGGAFDPRLVECQQIMEWPADDLRAVIAEHLGRSRIPEYRQPRLVGEHDRVIRCLADRTKLLFPSRKRASLSRCSHSIRSELMLISVKVIN
jgi:hypothetical protein